MALGPVGRRPCFFVRVDYGLIKAAAAARSTHLTRTPGSACLKCSIPMKEFCEASPDQFVELRLDSGAVAIWMRKTTRLTVS
jgi:hypothetical protein